VREKILEELRKAPGGLTYQDLAVRLNANEASIRRTVKQELVPQSLVRFDRFADYRGTDMVWVAVWKTAEVATQKSGQEF